MSKDIDCWGTDEIVCPHCGHKYSDSWEFLKGNNPVILDLTCENCLLDFKCTPEYELSYYSEKPEVEP